MKCIVCQKEYQGGYSHTCSGACHETWLATLQKQYGNYVPVQRMITGETFKVPLRVIFEYGIQEQDLDNYPRWQAGDSKFEEEES